MLASKNFWIKLLVLTIVMVTIGVGSIYGLFQFMSRDLPKLDKLQDYRPNLASQIYSKDGVILAELGLEKREVATIKEIPKLVIDAFLSAEDDAFYTHKGVDYWGLVRAMLANLKAGKFVQGGSTITQQVAKSFLLSSEKTITRKFKDFILAQRIEEKLTKEEILYLYLNQVYLGSGYYGVKAAARGYFNKELSQMTIAESSMLAGLLVAPGKYSPFVNPEQAKKRQMYVLDRMLNNKKITDKEDENAKNEKPLYYTNNEQLKAGYFTEWVRQVVVDKIGEENFLKNGYRIVTTLDYELQKKAEIDLYRGIKEIDKRQGYKGPVSNIKNDEIKNFEIESRKKILKENSKYFVIENGKKKFEHHFDEQAFLKIVEEQETLKNQNYDDFFVPGIHSEDKFEDVIKPITSYEAIVKKVDDYSKLIWVSLGGTVGVITHEHFKWAHKRSINENTAYFKEIEKPSEIVKVGDVIHVELVKKSVNLLPLLTKESLAAISKLKTFSLFKNQKYTLYKLDQIPEVQGALYSVDSKTGHVISYVGGSDYQKSKFNRVIQAKRQPGSAFKPLLFAAALEKGYAPNSIIMDTPGAMPGFDAASSWKPKNYDGEFLGPVTFRISLEQSRNIPTIKIADRVGVSNVIHFLNRIGFNANLENNLSIALGSFGVSLKDITATYGVFSNGGLYVYPKAIVSVTDRDGKKISINEDEIGSKFPTPLNMNTDAPNMQTGKFKREDFHGKRVYDAALSYQLNHILKGVITSGTGTGAREISNTIAGKTGTTSDYVDAWFIGYNAQIVTGVWTGFDDNRTMGYGETGGKASLAIWKEFMRNAFLKYGDQDFAIPSGIKFQWIEKKTGKNAIPNGPGAIYESLLDESYQILTDEEMNKATIDGLSEDTSTGDGVGTSGSNVNGSTSNGQSEGTNSQPGKNTKSKIINTGDDEYYDN